MDMRVSESKSWQFQIPNDITEKVVSSALYSFGATIVYSLILSRMAPIEMSAAVFNGGLAATASFIHALVTPLFIKFFGRTNIEWYQAGVLFVANFAITQTVVNACMNPMHQIDFAARLVYLTAVTLLFNCGKSGKFDLNQNGFYVLF